MDIKVSLEDQDHEELPCFEAQIEESDSLFKRMRSLSKGDGDMGFSHELTHCFANTMAVVRLKLQMTFYQEAVAAIDERLPQVRDEEAKDSRFLEKVTSEGLPKPSTFLENLKRAISPYMK
ncbi:MAG: hypothetical protein AAF549_08550 [Pseudomonadota bacterium]